MPKHANPAAVLRTLMLIVVPLVLSSCGVRGDGAGDTERSRLSSLQPTPASCELEDVNNWVYQSMLDYYLFYQQVSPNVNAASYESPEALVRDLRVAPNDTFSYVTDETTYAAFFNEGENFGYGWNFARAADDALFFSLIEPNSPLELAGVVRGDELIAINNIVIADLDRLSSAERSNIFGTADEIKTLGLTIRGADNIVKQVDVTKARYPLQTVLDTQVIESNGVNVGYLHFYQFVNTSSQELSQAFETFESAGVSELVIDLRFNGGGRISIANELASRVVGVGHQNDVFTAFTFNDKYQSENENLFFQSLQNSLSINRVFILQSANTCSASELVINSLRPFMEVITVGSTSCGKPYASSARIACDKAVNVLEIELLNAAGAGRYFDGIAADCPVAEDLSSALGARSEPLLRTALSYIDTGHCGLSARHSSHMTHQLTDEFKQQWQGGNRL